MKKVLVAALAAALTVLACLVPSAEAATKVETLEAPSPWYLKSEAVRDRIAAKGKRGASRQAVIDWARAERKRKGRQRAPEEPAPQPCGSADPSDAPAHVGACMVYPAGCTMNFVFKRGPEPAAEVSDGRNYFLGTAGHCVDRSNQEVIVEDKGTFTTIGTVEKHINGGIGNDYAIVQLSAGMPFDPADPTGQPGEVSPKNVYAGCEAPNVVYWGHGYEFAVGPGKAEGGTLTQWYEREFAWDGPAFGGDSGSGVTVEGPDGDEQAGGDLTHLVVDPARYGPAITAGTRVTRALTWMGGNYYLVNEDRTTDRKTMADTTCPSSNEGSGGGSTSSAGSLLTSVLGG